MRANEEMRLSSGQAAKVRQSPRMVRKTKIIATLGPATQELERIRALIQAGANVFRLNMSHAKPEWCRHMAQLVRQAAGEEEAQIALLMDLKGPTIRTGDLSTPLQLRAGDHVEFLLVVGDAQLPLSTSVNYPGLYADLRVGDTVVLDNGVLEMKVLTLSPERIICQALNDGMLGSRRHINLPGVKVNLPPLAAQDYMDLDLAAELGCEFVAMSFVRDASHLRLLRKEIDNRGLRAAIVAKFEDQQALRHRDEIIGACDVVMVARGDLGIEARMEELPIIQSRLVKECLRRGRIVIVATHMLESMIENPAPTRAEVTDVANAVCEQTDAIMLSGETSSGHHPVRCVQAMDKIARRMEQEIDASAGGDLQIEDDKQRVVRSAVTLADSFKHGRLLVFTKRGVMARYSAQARPVTAPIFAFCPDARVCRTLAIVRGVTAIPLEFTPGEAAAAIEGAVQLLRQRKLLTGGETLVIVSDMLHDQMNTDTIWVRKV